MRKSKLSKIFKIFIMLLLLLALAVAAWLIVRFVLGIDIQWWAKALMLTCLAGTGVTIFLLRKWWLKRKEVRFVDGIVGTDMPGNVSLIDDASRELRRRFKEGIATLQKSHLKGQGNPLYVLPWYLIVGKSGAGKSTAIRSARLSSPFGDINRISGVDGTRNCDWWFFDDSVVIDIAGRYSLHSNEDLDRSEWIAFLEHLVKYRKKEPINGIIVTVEADQLLSGNQEKIEDEGRTIRKRIDEVIHVMGAKFPIYLLVTKCDLVYGMDRFCHLLPESTLDQAMGLMNHDGETDIAAMVDRTMDTLVDKLKDIRLILVNKDEVRERHFVEPDVLLFPDELERLRKGLMVFCNGAFKDNPFQELAPVRGIYFCSGQQAGRPVTSQSGARHLGVLELPGTGHGFFLHDFFAKILPADRPLYAMTKRAREWHRMTYNLWLTGFVTVVLIFCILLTHSWNENKAALNAVSPEYRQALLFKDDTVADIKILIDFSRQIKIIEQINADWKTPRLGLRASIKLERDMKQRYAKRFYEHFEAGINARIESRIVKGGWDQNDFEPAVRYIPFMTRRINLIKAMVAGAGRTKLARMPDPDYVLMILGDDNTALTADILEGYKDAYINYLVWQKDVPGLNRTLTGMQRLLDNYFAENHGDLRWLSTWADHHLRGKRFTLQQFWGGKPSEATTVTVTPAFTQEGRKLISHFVMEELEKAVDGSLRISRPKEQFVDWYQNAYYGAWMNFCTHFHRGRELFKSDTEWEIVLEGIAGEDNPYADLLDALASELFYVGNENVWPSMRLSAANEEKYGHWLGLVRDFGIMRQAAMSEDLADNPLLKRLERKLPGKTRFVAKIALGVMEESRLAKSMETYNQYETALNGFSGITASRQFAHQIARAGFEDNPAEARSHLFAAHKATAGLKAVLDQKRGVALPSDQKDPFWCLFQEPIDFLWQFSVAQAGCYLQDVWDEEVIIKTQGIHDRQRLSSMLFGGQGHIDQFMKAHARPFVSQSSARGYFPRELQNAQIAFEPVLFRFLRQGRNWSALSSGSQQNHTVAVRALPTGVNPEARIKPFMTRLVLEGAEGPTTLENRQFPVERSFTWSSANDGNVVLQILFENMTLTTRYTGYCAFGKFLRDFGSGSRIFNAEVFPEHLTALNRIGVRYIEVNYIMQESQIGPVIRMLGAVPGGPPRRIVNCSGPTG
jgi:type VI secretion system protein ImpL